MLSRGTIAGMSGFDTEQLHRLVPFSDELGIRVVAAAPDAVRLELDWQARLCTADGVLHGGALMSLADTAGAVGAFLNLPDGAQGTATVNSTTHLLGAVREGTVSALATPLHSGGMLDRGGDRAPQRSRQTRRQDHSNPSDTAATAHIRIAVARLLRVARSQAAGRSYARTGFRRRRIGPRSGG